MGQGPPPWTFWNYEIGGSLFWEQRISKGLVFFSMTCKALLIIVFGVNKLVSTLQAIAEGSKQWRVFTQIELLRAMHNILQRAQVEVGCECRTTHV